jgi:hypothetical protein
MLAENLFKLFHGGNIHIVQQFGITDFRPSPTPMIVVQQRRPDNSQQQLQQQQQHR